jgi:hypothetical protein
LIVYVPHAPDGDHGKAAVVQLLVTDAGLALLCGRVQAKWVKAKVSWEVVLLQVSYEALAKASLLVVCVVSVFVKQGSTVCVCEQHTSIGDLCCSVCSVSE